MPCRLSTEKFQLDGQHTGTGGGNHIVLGRGQFRPTVPFSATSRHAQEHPGLLAESSQPVLSIFRPCSSGPPARRPRLDEAAPRFAVRVGKSPFDEIPTRAAAKHSPLGWSTASSANLLADSTGNTHRTEICIDKLYSPDGPAGRLGLVEFRNLRDAAACRDELGAIAVAAGLDRTLLARALSVQPGALGAPACMTAFCCRILPGPTSPT